MWWHVSTSPRQRGGQTTVEYLLVVSVIVVGLLAAKEVLLPGLRLGLLQSYRDSRQMVEDGYVGGGR